MELIENKGELIENIGTVENYLTEGSGEEQEEVANLIRRGSCLVAYKINDELRFAPSRFLGYVKNSLKRHDRSIVDGKETNLVINQILGVRPIENEVLRVHYLRYCLNLGFRADEKRHKFWNVELAEDFSWNELLTGEFQEGKIVERSHKVRERNQLVIEIAKDNFKRTHGRLFCQICHFDFEKTYGELDKDFIEGHHTVPVCEIKPGQKTRPEDIAMLCSNCHKMVHRRRPWLQMDQLKVLLS